VKDIKIPGKAEEMLLDSRKKRRTENVFSCDHCWFRKLDKYEDSYCPLADIIYGWRDNTSIDDRESIPDWCPLHDWEVLIKLEEDKP